jgi:predicted ATPase
VPAVIAICRELEGMPLAIELAPARLRAMSLAEILEGLGDRLALLDRGTRHVPARQRAVRTSIEWSWQLLEPEERRLLSELAVFVGEFDARTVIAVCAEDQRPAGSAALVVVGARPPGAARRRARHH